MKKAKTTSVAKPAKGAKAPAPSRQKLQQEITSLRSEVSSAKHKPAPSKKHKTTTAKHSTKRGVALGEGLACCAAEALAMSLRLAGGSVTADDVEALYWLTASHPDAGASILATLEAAHGYGIGGHFPAGYRPARGLDLERSVLLGLALPEGPHTVLADGDTWWSWGEPWPASAFSGAVVEEAWEVAWAS